MVRVFGCVVAALCCGGCLMANPAYLGETEGGTGGASGGASQGSSAGTTSTAATSETHGSGSAEGAGTTTSAVTTQSTTRSEGSSTTSGSAEDSSGDDTAGEVLDPCAPVDGLRVCVLFDVDVPEQVFDAASMYAISAEGGALLPSPWGNAYEFDAKTRVEVDCDGECAGGPVVTYEAWVRVDVAPQTRSGVIDNQGFLGMFVTDGLAVRCVSQNGTSEGGAIPLETWVHLACVADEGSLTAYLDGNAVGGTTVDPLSAIEMDDPLALGNDMPSFGDPLLGALDRVRVWDVAMSAAQVLEAATP